MAGAVARVRVSGRVVCVMCGVERDMRMRHGTSGRENINAQRWPCVSRYYA